VVKREIDTISILMADGLEPQLPRYKAIANTIINAIRAGQLTVGSKLPPHRRLADRLGVTVGTISRAYSEVEKLGLLVARIGDGSYVRDPDRGEQGLFRAVIDDAPNVIDLSLNTNIPLHPPALLATTLAQVAGDPRCAAEVLRYQPDSGLGAHRAAGLRWMQRSGVEGAVESVIVTNGAQHGLLCTLMAVTRPGDCVAAEGLSYPGLTAVARHLGLRLRGVAMDAEGVIPEALEELCLHSTIRALFCTPTLHNPTTAMMSVGRREALAAVARRHNLVVIEDDVHGSLVRDHPLPLQGLAPERTVFITSLSKAIASGLRVGYLLVPEKLRMKIALAVRASCWMATPLVVEVATRWIEGGEVDQLISLQREEIGRRKALVAPWLAPLEHVTHGEGFHFWITLPEPWRANELAEELRHAGVLVKPADAFAIDQFEAPQAIRASVSGVAGTERLQEGFRKIHDLLAS